MGRNEQHHDRAVDEDRCRDRAQRSNFRCAARRRCPEQDCRTEEHQQEIADADLVAQPSSRDALEQRQRCAEQHEQQRRARQRPRGERQETRRDREHACPLTNARPMRSTRRRLPPLESQLDARGAQPPPTAGPAGRTSTRRGRHAIRAVVLTSQSSDASGLRELPMCLRLEGVCRPL